jgi:hypothetical protein
VTLTREERLAESAAKIRAPFALDPDLRFYSPQENRDALDHPLVADWIRFVVDEWVPPAVDGARARLGLLLPCTKSKPYPTSREHRAINAALLDAGWSPTGPDDAPAQLRAALEPDEDPAVLRTGPLRRDGVVLDRFVVSEPLALVPYGHVYWWRGDTSPATAYDDPGLFEARGTSVSPYRPDSTATRRADGRWRWGPAERDAYVDVHNRLAEAIAAALARVAPHYSGLAAWVSPGLTHRSFLLDGARRRAEGIAASRRGEHGPRRLIGVLDHHPGLLEVLPTRADMDASRERLARRLAAEVRSSSDAAARSVFARGDGHDTPLGLPELLASLVDWLDRSAASADD